MPPPLSASHIPEASAPQARNRSPVELLAWAAENGSDNLRYIGELTEHERGSACDCSCIGCGHPLLAVNAARLDGVMRPHFRHQAGADHRRCQVKSARAALLARLEEGDVFVLPASRRTVTLTGLSGELYHGWVETGPTEVRVRQRRLIDSTTAELRLDDGRRLIVQVVGSAEAGSSGEHAGEALVPRIYIVNDDPEAAMLSPEELRARLFPALAAGLWCGHWPDPDADAQARAQAIAAADERLDWYDGSDEVPASLRRESILHREVKAILASASALAMPAWNVSPAGELRTDRKVVCKESVLGARLEKKLGRIIPDVIAELPGSGDLLVEVTVTNTITPERLERIRAVNLPTLEIDFSHMRGVLSRDALRVLVVDEVLGKKWLHHPDARPIPIPVQYDESLIYGWRWTKKPEIHREMIMGRPAAEWAADYLAAVRDLARLDFGAEATELPAREELRDDAVDRLLSAADGLHAHGYPEALDSRLFDSVQPSILHRLMSIMTGEPVADRVDTVWRVLNSILNERAPDRIMWHGLYLIALKARPAELTRAQEARVDMWAEKVKSSLRRGDSEFRRDPQYDRLLGVLFPEMQDGLSARSLIGEAITAPSRPMVDPARVDSKYFEGAGIYHWKWAVDSRTLVLGLALAASRARLDGYQVTGVSAMHRLCEIVNTAHSVETVVAKAASPGEIDEATVLRYLCQYGYIYIPSGPN